jgi:hypothetical protein
MKLVENVTMLPVITSLEKPADEPVLQNIEQYRLQMAGISAAALGYWKENDTIHPDYDTPALRDVAKLYTKYDALYKAQQDQGPVAYSYTSRITRRQTFSLHPKPPHLDSDSWDIKPLYTEPPKREWVGLTEEEISAIANKLFGFTYDAGADRPFARAIEAKLKEKNT